MLTEDGKKKADAGTFTKIEAEQTLDVISMNETLNSNFPIRIEKRGEKN
jgi:hypothetical protein